MCRHLNRVLPSVDSTLRPGAAAAVQRRGRHWYFSVHSAGKQYRRYCRRLIADPAAAPSEHDSMDLQQPEEVLLDEDELAGLWCHVLCCCQPSLAGGCGPSLNRHHHRMQ